MFMLAVADRTVGPTSRIEYVGKRGRTRMQFPIAVNYFMNILHLDVFVCKIECPTTSTPCEHPANIFCHRRGICCRDSHKSFCRLVSFFVGL